MQFIKTEEDCQDSMDIVADTTRILLKNGAETYRVEDAASRMSKSIQKVNKIDVFVSYTCVIIYLSFGFEDLVTMRGTTPKATNLWKIHQTNNFPRNFVNDICTLDESIEIINKIDKGSADKKLYILGATVVSGLLAHLLVGGIIEPVITSFISILEVPVFRFFQQKENPQFVNTCITIAFMTLLTMLTLKIFEVLNVALDMNSIIVGCIMPFVPGVSITNSVRDVLSRDLLSGVSSMINAIITTLSIVLGVGNILYFAVMIEAI